MGSLEEERVELESVGGEGALHVKLHGGQQVGHAVAGKHDLSLGVVLALLDVIGGDFLALLNLCAW